jgi:AraC family transcriptional regulator
MEPTLVTLPEKKLVGMHLQMSLAANRVADLWRAFMPRRAEIHGTLTKDLISMQIYASPADIGSPTALFEKWAAVEVANFEDIPAGMNSFLLPAGLYADFHYVGSSADSSIFRHIFGVWLPASGFQLDHRPHFEILGEKYKNLDPTSEEDIYIPIKQAGLPQIPWK